MSDIESDYYSDSNSDNESQEEETILDTKNKQVIAVNAARKFGSYDNDIDSVGTIDDSEPNEDEIEHDDDDDDNDELIQKGGNKKNVNNSIKIIQDDEIDIEEEEDDEDDDDDIEEYEEEYKDKNNSKKGSSLKPIKQTNTNQFIIEDQDEDYDDEYEENYLQKFDNDINKNYIMEFHPECLNNNYDEVLKLCKVIRNDANIIIDPFHRTLPYLTKYEKARIIGQRAKQIETGSKPLIKVPENIIDGYVIAELELREKKIPFIIKRPIPSGAFEYWRVQDLENINF